jgi:hypothetical protein
MSEITKIAFNIRSKISPWLITFSNVEVQKLFEEKTCRTIFLSNIEWM